MSGIDVTEASKHIIESGTLAAFMLLVIAGLCWFVLYLMSELKETRKESTDALINSTAVIAEFKEIVRAALHR